MEAQTAAPLRFARVVAGTASDETGGVLLSARVELLDTSSAFVQTAGSDANGRFQFGQVAVGWRVHKVPSHAAHFLARPGSCRKPAQL